MTGGFLVHNILVRCILFLLVLAAPAFAQVRSENAREVIWTGITPEDQANIEKKLPELKTNRPSPAVLDEAIRQLMLLEVYQTVTVSEIIDGPNAGHYRIAGLLLKRIGEIKIGGNHAVNDDDIMVALNLRTESRFDINLLQTAGERVKELYGKRGYFNAIVSFDFQDMSRTDVRVLVSIRERPPCLIRGVNFVTDNPELSTKLISLVKRSIGKPFTEEGTIDIEATINDYLKDHRYINSQLNQKEATYNSEHTEAHLTYEVTDPYSYEVYVTGTQYYSDRDIIRNLKLDTFASGSRDPGLDVSNTLRTYYIHNGFPNVRVTFQEKIVPELWVKRLNFNIDEGSRIHISQIEIVGRISRPANYYSEFISEHSSDMVKKNFYVKEDLDNGLKNLGTELNNQGYLRAKVQSSRTEYNDKKTEAKFVVNLDEGPLTHLTRVEFTGVKSFDTNVLIRVLTIRPNAPLHLNELEDSIAELKKYYLDHGFLEMRLLNDNSSVIEYDDKGLFAVVHFKVEEGPQIFVRAIYIEGLTFTKEYVVRRQITVEVGDLLTPDVLEENRRIIDKIGVFSRVEIRMLEANTNVSQRTLVISVTERNPGLFKVTGGLTNQNELTVRGRAGISYNNIGGTARAASIFGIVQSSFYQINLLEYEIDVGYKEPFLFNSRWLGRVDYSHSEYLEAVNEDELLVTDRLTFSAERDINSRVKFTWLTYGIDSISQYLIQTSGPEELETKIHIAYFGPIIDADYSDNRFLPTKGNYMRWQAIYADPNIGSSATVQFFRTEATFTHYMPLPRPKWVWANSVRGGYERNYIEGSGIPLSYAFFLGGYTTIRGYSGTNSDRIPNGNELPINDTTVFAPPATSYSDYYLLKSEIRYPIVDPLGGVVFWDAGEVDIGGLPFHSPFRQSIGVGLRINTPVGPLSLDYGHKLDQQDGEGPDAWHLFIGTF
jgi:outer membrane protein assembly complex protein YaeT